MIIKWIRLLISRWISSLQKTAQINSGIVSHDATHQAFASAELESAYAAYSKDAAHTPAVLHTAVTDMPIASADASNGISYSPTLIDSLKDDHSDLIEMYSEIAHIMAAGHYDAIPEALTSFKTKLDVHLLTENLRFYCYLEQNLTGHAAELELMKSFRREMSNIARSVVGFVRKWQFTVITKANKDSFLDEYAQIGAALTQRIEREENTLYTLYMAA
jgi:regulator of sigma D